MQFPAKCLQQKLDEVLVLASLCDVLHMERILFVLHHPEKPRQVLQLSLLLVVSCKMPTTANRQGTCLCILEWCNADRNIPICVISSKESKPNGATVGVAGSLNKMPTIPTG
jgi:hypothetical protein